MTDRAAPIRPTSGARMTTLLICQEGALLDEVGLSRWLASFSRLTGVIVLKESGKRKRRRIVRELKRVGPLRFLDVVAFRLYYHVRLARADRRWEEQKLEDLCRIYPVPPEVARLVTDSPNGPAAEAFIRSRGPDIILARCKTLLKPAIFSLASTGTFVLHPGICPEYRNAHGCFWALAEGDRERVGMTLLRIDAGVDTGPVYGYYRCHCDPARESHVVIQHRVVLDNLPALAARLTEIHEGRAHVISCEGRRSGAWGQPWLTRYLRLKRRARDAA